MSSHRTPLPFPEGSGLLSQPAESQFWLPSLLQAGSGIKTYQRGPRRVHWEVEQSRCDAGDCILPGERAEEKLSL